MNKIAVEDEVSQIMDNPTIKKMAEEFISEKGDINSLNQVKVVATLDYIYRYKSGDYSLENISSVARAIKNHVADAVG